MVRIDGNGRDGGGSRQDIPLTYSPSFHFLFLSFSFCFLFPSFFLFFLTFFIYFVTNFFLFQRYLKISKEFTGNKDMEELFRGGLKRVYQDVKCNV